MNIPKGQRYELCRAVHAEQNAIISASRADLMGSDIYLACHDAKTGKIDGAIESMPYVQKIYYKRRY